MKSDRTASAKLPRPVSTTCGRQTLISTLGMAWLLAAIPARGKSLDHRPSSSSRAVATAGTAPWLLACWVGHRGPVRPPAAEDLGSGAPGCPVAATASSSCPG